MTVGVEHARPLLFFISGNGPAYWPVEEHIEFSDENRKTLKLKNAEIFHHFLIRKAPWQWPTLPGGCPPSTIGADELNCRVRDGTGCFARAMTTKPRKNQKTAIIRVCLVLRLQADASRRYSNVSLQKHCCPSRVRLCFVYASDWSVQGLWLLTA